jgi:CBS domain-containing protein
MEVLQIMADSGLKHLPILAGDGSRRLLGVITRGSLMRRYDRELRKRLS